MDKLVKSKGSFKTVLEVAGIEVAHCALMKWWNTDMVIQKGDHVYATLSKDSFWRWHLSLMRQEECLLKLKAKFWGGIEIHAPNGEIWKFKKKGASDNQLILLNDKDEEVLFLEKQGKWWKHRPYQVMKESTDHLPLQDEVLPLVIVAALGIFNQRSGWIVLIFVSLQFLIRHFSES